MRLFEIGKTNLDVLVSRNFGQLKLLKTYKIKRFGSKISLICIMFFMLSTVFSEAKAQERIGGWGNLFFGMNKKTSGKYINEICPVVYEESNQEIIGENCAIIQLPFRGLNVDVSLHFSDAFFDRNKILEKISFTIKDTNEEELKAIYSYAAKKWLVKKDWNCGKKKNYSSIKSSSVSCGATFSDNYIHLKAIYLNVGEGSKSIQLKNRKAQIVFLSFLSIPLPIFL